MQNGFLALLGLGLLAGGAQAQDASFIPQATQDVGYGGVYNGPGSVGSSEPLIRYDDQERWKHGLIRSMPYYEGYHSFRPYNYHHVFSQSQTSAGWGMPATMPYSQQFWHRYEGMTDLSRGDHSPVAPYVPPPSEFDHYPKPLREGTFLTPPPAEALPQGPGPAPGIFEEQTPGRSQFSSANILPAQGAVLSTQFSTPISTQGTIGQSQPDRRSPLPAPY